MRQAIIVICISTTRVIVISSWLSEHFFRLGNNPGMYIGELKTGSGILAWWGKLVALDGAWVVRRIVGDGEVVEEMIFSVGSIAPVGFNEIGWIVPKAIKDASVACYDRLVGTVGFVSWSSRTAWCGLGKREEGEEYGKRLC